MAGSTCAAHCDDGKRGAQRPCHALKATTVLVATDRICQYQAWPRLPVTERGGASRCGPDFVHNDAPFVLIDIPSGAMFNIEACCS